MQAYRQKATSLAVQYTGKPIPDVTCGGSSTDEAVRQAARQLNGCDPSRAHLPHVHTAQVGGLGIVTPGCWIMPVRGGPFCVVEDAQFRAHFEVPEPFVENPPSPPPAEPYPDPPAEPYIDPVPAAEPDPLPAVDPTAEPAPPAPAIDRAEDRAEDPTPPAPTDEPTDTSQAAPAEVDANEPAVEAEAEPTTSAADEPAAPAEEAAPPKHTTKKARQ